ncbi:MAG TPA: DUF262 domain-containing protein [Flavipsychrobacter sp.]|nr:DUF262 domain-containing protein [Flavipsychrobacter sp.]
MKNFDTRTYSIADFIEWDKNGVLEISPDFQRRSVWTDKAKSYLIDTIFRGKPMPKIIITQRLEGAKNVRVVVDGQQRLRAILEFYNNDFKISSAHNRELSKYTYQAMPEDLRKEYLKYELGVDLLFDTPYEEILDIFARINSYTVKLNQQEAFNAKYLGYFKQSVYRLGFRYVKYFIDGGIFTKAKVSRMAEAELSADLIIALLDEVQTNKNVEHFYEEYEDQQGNLEEVQKKFDKIMSFIGAIYSAEELSNTNFARQHLFYTLFVSIGHFLFGVNGLDKKSRKNITERNVGKIRIALDNFSATFDLIASDLDNPKHPKDFKDFIYFSRRGTTDTSARVYRSNFLCKQLLKALS